MRKIWQFSLLIGLEILLFSLAHILVQTSPTASEVGEVCSQLRRLFPLISINPRSKEVLSALSGIMFLQR